MNALGQRETKFLSLALDSTRRNERIRRLIRYQRDVSVLFIGSIIGIGVAVLAENHASFVIGSFFPPLFFLLIHNRVESELQLLTLAGVIADMLARNEQDERAA